ncbi:hypothetical protein [Allokutzneria oryzae]|uniref:V-type ATPase subunit n=1 Tax=Allokutzneria oryzae TaxID=1378989 RepID=A0ABV6A3Q9_9PSEU
MNAAWTAGGVRAGGLLNRRLGTAATNDIARCASLADAVSLLVATPYGFAVRRGQTLVAAEHALSATVLWHLRVLAGWLPRHGAHLMRLLAGWFEIANLLDHLRTLCGADPQPRYVLGSLATAWPRLAETSSTAQLRAVLAASPWGDPGTTEPWGIATAVHLSWAARVASASPYARAWAVGGAALLTARARFVVGRSVPEPARRWQVLLLGARQAQAHTLAAFGRRLPAEARWALCGVEDPDELWRAEEQWWTRLDRDASATRRRPGFGPAHAVSCAALLAVDARRCRAALELAARGGSPQEALDALA